VNFPFPEGFLPSAAIAGGIDGFTVLMLHLDGVNGSTTFVDSSPYNHTGSLSGVTIGTAQSKFGGASAQFSVFSAIQIPNNADWEFGARDFTVDWWEYRTAATANCCVIARDGVSAPASGVVPWIFGYSDGANLRAYVQNTSTWDMLSGVDMGTIVLNAWSHRAITRQGSTFRTFKDGVLVATVTAAQSIAVANTVLSIGQQGNAQSGATFQGFIDELRISRGIARWMASFTLPAAPYTAVSPTDNDGFTRLLLHCDGLNGSTTFTDSSPYAHAVTPTAVTIGTAQSKFGGASAQFSVFGAIQSPNSGDWEFGAGDFTVDWWEYRTIATANCCVITRDPVNPQWSFGYSDGTNLRAYAYSSSYTPYDVLNAVDMGVIVLNAWSHRAVTRKGNTFRTFKDGVLISTVTSSLALAASGSVLSIGQAGNAPSGQTFQGFIDELRICKGIARWTASFTPPAAPYS
jgi:hypothetical protein